MPHLCKHGNVCGVTSFFSFFLFLIIYLLVFAWRPIRKPHSSWRCEKEKLVQIHFFCTHGLYFFPSCMARMEAFWVLMALSLPFFSFTCHFSSSCLEAASCSWCKHRLDHGTSNTFGNVNGSFPDLFIFFRDFPFVSKQL